jgi:hypothetical protein
LESVPSIAVLIATYQAELQGVEQGRWLPFATMNFKMWTLPVTAGREVRLSVFAA